MKEEIEVITLEDGLDYEVIDEIIENGTKYIYLSNEENEKDFCIRKEIIEEGQEFIVGLDSKTEFDKALLYFTKKHKDYLK